MYSKIRQSISAREAFELVKSDLELVEREISVESVASNHAITTINQYLQSGGGKRLRPALLLLCNRLFGPSDDVARRLAAVVEMIHTATLVHDDVIDLARTRRGRPSSNVVWGNHISVLAGDWLYMQAFQVALRERNFHLLDVLISLTQMMVEGELLQLERLRRMDITEVDYMELVERKTASLFSATTGPLPTPPAAKRGCRSNCHRRKTASCPPAACLWHRCRGTGQSPGCVPCRPSKLRRHTIFETAASCPWAYPFCNRTGRGR